MNINQLFRISLSIFLIVLSQHATHAAYVPNVNIQSLSSEFFTANDSRRATNLLNDVGLFGDIVTSIPNGSSWLTKTAPAQVHTNFVVFDLGAVRPVQSMVVWNYNESANLTAIPPVLWPKRGVGVADISISSDGSTFTTNLASAVFNAAPGLFTNNFAQTFNFGGAMARFVRINIQTNHGELGADVSAGLNKVRFVDTNVPPRLTFASLNYSSNKVTATFSESVTASTATNIANYSIQTGGTTSATILSASFDLYNNRVALQTTTLSNSSYTLVASGVTAVSDGTTITNNSSVPIEKEFAIWLKADAGVAADGSGFVSQWTDQSGNANNALQANPVFQPTLVSGAINGQPVLHFTANVAATNFLQIAPASTLITLNDYSIVAVVRATDMANPPNFYGVINKVNPVTGQPLPFDLHIARISATSGNVRCYRGQGFNNTAMNGLTNVAPGQSFIVTCVQRGTIGNQFLNGAFNQRVESLIGADDGNRPVTIGSREGFGVRMNGDIAEVMLIRGALTDSERIRIHDYLSAKYGIPVVNLNITEQPASVNKLEGQTATFSVTAVASEPTISYQWQRYGTNLPNATNATYTTPTLTLSDDGTPFRVLLSIPNTNVISAPATLTVSPDAENPTVTSAGRAIWDQSLIVVFYSESVTPLTATNLANYSLDNGGAVTSAAMGDAANKVVLTTTMTNGGTYLLSVQNVKDLFNNPIISTQVPLTVYPVPMALWLKADVGVTADGSGLVSQWDDQSGNNNHVTQSSAANMPKIVPNAFNGQPAINFIAGNINYLLASSSPSLAILGDISIITVARFQSFTNYNSLVAKTSGTGQPASYDFYTVNANNGRSRLLRGNGVGNSVSTGTLALGSNVVQIVSATMNGTNSTHFIDGRTNGTGFISTSTIADNGDPLVIGGRADLVTRMNGDIAEIMVFGSALSQADRTAIDNYLGVKYGVVVGSLPRISITSASTSNISFSWPTPSVPMTFESATNLALPIWTPVTNAISNSGGSNSVTLPTTGAQQYFRLHRL